MQEGTGLLYRVPRGVREDSKHQSSEGQLAFLNSRSLSMSSWTRCKISGSIRTMGFIVVTVVMKIGEKSDVLIATASFGSSRNAELRRNLRRTANFGILF